MKKIKLLFALILGTALLMVLASCNKDTAAPQPVDDDDDISSSSSTSSSSAATSSSSTSTSSSSTSTSSSSVSTSTSSSASSSTSGGGPMADAAHHWAFESGALDVDSIGGLTVPASASGVPPTSIAGGKVGNCAQANTMGMMSVADTTGFNPTSVTIAVWFQLNALQSTYDGNGYIIERDDSAAGGCGVYIAGKLSSSTKDNIRWFVRVGTTKYEINTATDSLSAGVWYHIVCTYDQTTGTQNIYVNGSSTPAATGSGAGPMAAITYNTTGTDKLNIVGKSTTSVQGIDGKIDELVTWNRALSGAEVAALYATYP